jgi:CMP-N-acetylneuraminic acid synthetase
VIFITGAKNVSFTRNQFRNNLYMQRGAVYISNTSFFSDSASIYQNNAGYQGSAFFIERSQARL